MKKAVKKIRGFVMTGGGAKGFYEAGVIHAFHITGMEFDVITGSSIGAMNSIVAAEYLYRKRLLPAADRADPLAAIERMDPYVKAFHRTWLRISDIGLLNDSEQGPLGKLKDNLADFNISLPQLVRLGWWYKDPARGKLPGLRLWPDLVGLIWQTVRRIGDSRELLGIVRDHRQGLVRTALRTYLRQFGLERSFVPAGGDSALADAFTNPIRPLMEQHLAGDVMAEYGAGAPIRLVEPERTLRDYAAQNIDVRLTRANYRTGRLEVSHYVRPEDFVRFMQKHNWRLETADPTAIPLGSFRLQIPGNPKAIDAGLASGRYPGVFVPYSLEKIYPETDPENELLYRLVDHWLNDPGAEKMLREGYDKARAEQADLYAWEVLRDAWKKSKRMHGFFPVRTDNYVDGGAIDNTPSNPAVDAARECVESRHDSRRDTELELFVIYLETEPRVGPADTSDASILDIVQRTLQIVGVAKKSADSETVNVINGFGERAADLGRALMLVADGYREALQRLPEADRRAAEERLHRALIDAGVTVRASKASGDPAAGQDGGFVGKVSSWAEQMVSDRLPLPVTKVTVYPDKMPLGTLQFTPRLGYNKESAIEMITLGCINTLFTLRNHLEREKNQVDEKDKQTLELAQRWMGVADWPEDEQEQLALRDAWQCRRTECAFHAHYCARGYRLPLR